MNTTENLVSPEDGAITSQPENAIIKPIKFPSQPQEWKIVSLRECPTSDEMQQFDTPEKAAAYWRAPVTHHPYFNSQCECLVLFILHNQRDIQAPQQAA